MYQTGIHRSFRAIHYLSGESIQESRPHEHRYSLELLLACTELDENGLVVDRAVMDECLTELLRSVEGHLLNDEPIFDDCPPTAENVARFFCDEITKRLSDEGFDLKRLASIAVRLWESESCWASFSREPRTAAKAAAPIPRRRAPSRREPVKKPLR